jgi:transcriptional regulator with XRE-family HTH domain
MKRPTSPTVSRAAVQIGEFIASWRRLHGLTADQVAQRANITRKTLWSLEHGSVGTTLETYLAVLNALGVLRESITALDPFESDLGKARAELLLPKRSRQ